ncbi:MAG: hypothetical protein ABI240_14245, partial [Sphingomonas sp.]
MITIASGSALETGEPLVLSGPATLPDQIIGIPYAFARRFGVALEIGEGSHLSIAMREGSDP